VTSRAIILCSERSLKLLTAELAGGMGLFWCLLVAEQGLVGWLAFVCVSVWLPGSICVYLPIDLSLSPSHSPFSHPPSFLLYIYSSFPVFLLRRTISYALPNVLVFVTLHGVVCVCLCVLVHVLCVSVPACVCVFLCVFCVCVCVCACALMCVCLCVLVRVLCVCVRAL
jgi:hypothetical protein